jgi:hypothetical protein
MTDDDALEEIFGEKISMHPSTVKILLSPGLKECAQSVSNRNVPGKTLIISYSTF